MLSRPVFARIASHVECCAVCGSALEALDDRADSLLGQLRQPAEGDDPAESDSRNEPNDVPTPVIATNEPKAAAPVVSRNEPKAARESTPQTARVEMTDEDRNAIFVEAM